MSRATCDTLRSSTFAKEAHASTASHVREASRRLRPLENSDQSSARLDRGGLYVRWRRIHSLTLPSQIQSIEAGIGYRRRTLKRCVRVTGLGGGVATAHRVRNARTRCLAVFIAHAARRAFLYCGVFLRRGIDDRRRIDLRGCVIDDDHVCVGFVTWRATTRHDNGAQGENQGPKSTRSPPLNAGGGLRDGEHARLCLGGQIAITLLKDS